tara:strand:+ start:46 stop:1125 length:1080 start_codon:yes stop_codon:yes gene_type:complete
MSKINVGIIGGSGFTGGELCRILLSHRKVNNIYPTSRDKLEFNKVHSNLFTSKLKFISIDQIKKQKIDVVFLCTKTKESISYTNFFLNKKIKVIDLSGAFRFSKNKNFFNAYGKNHPSKSTLKKSVYGLTEFNRDKIRKAKLISNPGCYAICAIYSLAPLAHNKILGDNKNIKIHAINGTTGAGSKLRKEINHASMANNMLAYNAEGHRHSPEIEDKLNYFFNIHKYRIDLNTAHGNFSRGIFMQISIPIKKTLTRDQLLTVYKKFYSKKIINNQFIYINDLKKTGKKNDKDYKIYPTLNEVIGTNKCAIGLDFDKRLNIIKIISVLDNLIKGAAGSAIQNMNNLYGFDDGEGLVTNSL